MRDLCAEALRAAGEGPGTGVTARCDEALARAADPRSRARALDAIARIGQRHGWFGEARDALELLVREDPGRRAELAGLLARGWSFDAALDALGDAPNETLLRADLLAGAGRADDAVAALASAPPGVDVSARLIALGQHTLAAARDPKSLAAATLALWRGDLDAAEARASAIDAPTILGAVRALRGDLSGALSALDDALARAPRDAEARCWRAEVLLRLGRAEEALDEARRAGESSPEFTQYVPALLVRYRAELALGRAVQLPRGALIAALRALLPRRGDDIDAALPGAPRPQGPPRPAEVMELLDTALASLDSVDATRWLRGAVAHLRAGRFEEGHAEALRALKHSAHGDPQVAARVVAHRCEVALGRFEGFAAGPFTARLTALAPRHADTVARSTQSTTSREASIAALLDDALAALGGNRSFHPVFARDGALLPLPVEEAPRRLAKQTLWRVVIDGDARTLAALAEVVARFPSQPEPHLYVGELHLWRGRWALARAAFERALSLQRHTRWGWIGLGAAALGEGNVAGALDTFARGEREAGGVGPTMFVYRGEARWRAGDLVRARADLEHACQRNPTRISAWMLLALVAHAQGDARRRDEAAREARARAPGLVGDAADDCGEDLPPRAAALSPACMERVFLAALAMMRGNRSSNYPTYHLRDGRLRVATIEPDAAGDEVLIERARALERSAIA